MPGKTYSPRELIDILISYDTTSRDSNLDLIYFVQDYLKGWGIDSILIPNEDGSKANLYATVGPQDRGGIVLSGHTDVVPVDGQNWSTDPFKVSERDGKLPHWQAPFGDLCSIEQRVVINQMEQVFEPDRNFPPSDRQAHAIGQIASATDVMALPRTDRVCTNSLER